MVFFTPLTHSIDFFVITIVFVGDFVKIQMNFATMQRSEKILVTYSFTWKDFSRHSDKYFFRKWQACPCW